MGVLFCQKVRQIGGEKKNKVSEREERAKGKGRFAWMKRGFNEPIWPRLI